MKIACLCPTYKRPAELAAAIECFLRQDYPAELCELIVLDDANQYENQEVFHELYPAQPGPGLRVFPSWRLISVPFRFRTLGEKRNASAALVSPDVDAYCVWDDDDIYLPWHIGAAVAALADADYTIPTVIYNDKRNRLQRKSNQYLFHGAWAFRRQAFEQVSGYPFIQSGQDQGLLRRFKSAKLCRADPIQHDPRPSYIYRWFTSHQTHISAMGSNGYEKLGQAPSPPIANIEPRWDIDWSNLAAKEMETPS